MSLDINARVAVLEDQNETCEEERKVLDKRLDDHQAVLLQVKGGIRLLVVLWTIAVAILGARELLPRAAEANPTIVQTK